MGLKIKNIAFKTEAYAIKATFTGHTIEFGTGKYNSFQIIFDLIINTWYILFYFSNKFGGSSCLALAISGLLVFTL
jgi:hypothetical protein